MAPPSICSGAAYSGVNARAAVSVAAVAAVAIDQQGGDAEVEQLHPAGAVDEDVRRLQVAVHDQVGVGVGDGIGHLQDEPEARPQTSRRCSSA